MLRKIVRLRIFKFHARKFNYLPFPTTIKLGRICAPCLGHIRPKAAHVRFGMCIRGYPDGAAHYFHDGSIICTHVRVYVRMHVRTHTYAHMSKAIIAHTCENYTSVHTPVTNTYF